MGELIGDCLVAVGGRRVFGLALPGLDHVPVADPVLARLLADADGRVGPGPGVAHLPGGLLRVSSRPGTAAGTSTVSDLGSLPGLLASWTLGQVHACREYHLDLDFAQPVTADLAPFDLDADEELYSLSPSLAELTLVTVAGPGVVRDGQVDALQMFAAQAGCGVLNSWGAKGVFRWDSPFHLGTGGLQERDAELAGLLDADLVIAVGIDPDETPLDQWKLKQVLEVEPRQLAALAFTWPEPHADPLRSRLYTELAEVLRPLYARDSMPMSAPRAAADLAATRPAGGLLAADPGPAGLWIGRTFPTTEPGSVVVPATTAPGLAAAVALVGTLEGRPAVAVTAEPVDPTTYAVLELAESLHHEVSVLVWGERPGPCDSVDAYRRLLEGAWSGELTGRLDVPVDFGDTAALVEVAGPVTAWVDR